MLRIFSLFSEREL